MNCFLCITSWINYVNRFSMSFEKFTLTFELYFILIGQCQLFIFKKSGVSTTYGSKEKKKLSGAIATNVLKGDIGSFWYELIKRYVISSKDIYISFNIYLTRFKRSRENTQKKFYTILKKNTKTHHHTDFWITLIFYLSGFFFDWLR